MNVEMNVKMNVKMKVKMNVEMNVEIKVEILAMKLMNHRKFMITSCPVLYPKVCVLNVISAE